MLHETKKQLLAHKIKMNISFVLLPDQQTVYHAFLKQLNEIELTDLAVSHKTSTKNPDDQLTIPYDKKSRHFCLANFNPSICLSFY